MELQVKYGIGRGSSGECSHTQNYFIGWNPVSEYKNGHRASDGIAFQRVVMTKSIERIL